MSKIKFTIDDLEDLPRVQRYLLEMAIKRLSTGQVTINCAAEAVRVTDRIQRALDLKLSVLKHESDDEVSVYLSGLGMIRASGDIIRDVSQWPALTLLGAESLLESRVIVRNSACSLTAEWQSALEQRTGSTDWLSPVDAEQNFKNLTRVKSALKFEDYRLFQQRPWMTLDAPDTRNWVELALNAMKEDPGFAELLTRDFREGKVRDSLVYQLREGLPDPVSIPGSVRSLDDSFIPRELRPDDVSLRQMRSSSLKWRILMFRMTNVYRLKGAGKLAGTVVTKFPRFLFKRGVGVLKKIRTMAGLLFRKIVGPRSADHVHHRRS